LVKSSWGKIFHIQDQSSLQESGFSYIYGGQKSLPHCPFLLFLDIGTFSNSETSKALPPQVTFPLHLLRCCLYPPILLFPPFGFALLPKVTYVFFNYSAVISTPYFLFLILFPSPPDSSLIPSPISPEPQHPFLKYRDFPEVGAVSPPFRSQISSPISHLPCPSLSLPPVPMIHTSIYKPFPPF